MYGMEKNSRKNQKKIEEDIAPFKKIADGLIQHLKHKHLMRFHKEIDKAIEDSKLCQA